MTNRLIPYQTGHLAYLDIGGDDLQYLNFDSSDLPDPIAFTLLVDGMPAGCGGIMPILPGVGECWIVAGKTKVLTLCKYAKCAIEKGFVTYHRLQMMVREGNEVNLRFAEYLGFKYEGIQQCYDLMGNNYIRMARIRDVW